jgi:hypothetical protein
VLFSNLLYAANYEGFKNLISLGLLLIPYPVTLCNSLG